VDSDEAGFILCGLGIVVFGFVMISQARQWKSSEAIAGAIRASTRAQHRLGEPPRSEAEVRRDQIRDAAFRQVFGIVMVGLGVVVVIQNLVPLALRVLGR
jgi:hypothetical protein